MGAYKWTPTGFVWDENAAEATTSSPSTQGTKQQFSMPVGHTEPQQEEEIDPLLSTSGLRNIGGFPQFETPPAPPAGPVANPNPAPPPVTTGPPRNPASADVHPPGTINPKTGQPYPPGTRIHGPQVYSPDSGLDPYDPLNDPKTGYGTPEDYFFDKGPGASGYTGGQSHQFSPDDLPEDVLRKAKLDGQKSEWDSFMQQFGLSDLPGIPDEELPENPMISTTFDPKFEMDYGAFVDANVDHIGGFYNQGNWPTMQAAQMDQSGIPQTQAAQAGSNQALDHLLTGQGFDPQIMSLMRGQATDDRTRTAAGERSSARLAAQRAGLENSGAALAMEGQVNRRMGDDINRAQNDLSIENAMRGLENTRMGAGMELGRETTNAGMRNEAALANASRLFQGMQQNVANVQQSNLTNTNNQQGREMARAGAQAGTQSQLAGTYGNAMVNKAASADEQNAANTINRGLNNAQLRRQKQMYNTGLGENRYSQAFQGMLGLINNANPSSYAGNAAQVGAQYNPNLIGANAMNNFGTTLLNAGSRV